jgi:hypothetical protein
MGKHWAFSVFLAQIQNGKSAAEAKAFILSNFPQLEDGYLTRILDNMGDVEKADIDYANQVINQQFRTRLEGMRSRQVVELSDDAIRGGKSLTGIAPDLNPAIRGNRG